MRRGIINQCYAACVGRGRSGWCATASGYIQKPIRGVRCNGGRPVNHATKVCYGQSRGDLAGISSKLNCGAGVVVEVIIAADPKPVEINAAVNSGPERHLTGICAAAV